jgi:hypothetical protein
MRLKSEIISSSPLLKFDFQVGLGDAPERDLQDSSFHLHVYLLTLQALEDSFEILPAFYGFKCFDFYQAVPILIIVLGLPQRSGKTRGRHLQGIRIRNQVPDLQDGSDFTAQIGAIFDVDSPLTIYIDPQYPAVRFPPIFQVD